MLRQLMLRFAGDSSGEMLWSTARAAAAVAIFSIGAAYVLSDRIEAEKRVLDQLAADAARNGARSAAARSGIDMTTTGSVMRGGQSVRIDPCGEPAKR